MYPIAQDVEVPRCCRRLTEVGFYDSRIRYNAQSVLMGLVEGNYLPTLEEATDIIRWAYGENFGGIH